MKWLQLWLTSKKPKWFAVFGKKNKREREIWKKKGGGSWEEWLNTIESFCINTPNLCWISTLFQILSKSVHTVKVKWKKDWMVFSRLSHCLPTSSIDWTLRKGLPHLDCCARSALSYCGVCLVPVGQWVCHAGELCKQDGRGWSGWMLPARPRIHTLYYIFLPEKPLGWISRTYSHLLWSLSSDLVAVFTSAHGCRAGNWGPPSELGFKLLHMLVG